MSVAVHVAVSVSSGCCLAHDRTVSKELDETRLESFQTHLSPWMGGDSRPLSGPLEWGPRDSPRVSAIDPETRTVSGAAFDEVLGRQLPCWWLVKAPRLGAADYGRFAISLCNG